MIPFALWKEKKSITLMYINRVCSGILIAQNSCVWRRKNGTFRHIQIDECIVAVVDFPFLPKQKKEKKTKTKKTEKERRREREKKVK